MSEESKQRLSLVIEAAKTVFHYGFIPTVLYLGKFTDIYHTVFTNRILVINKIIATLLSWYYDHNTLK